MHGTTRRAIVQGAGRMFLIGAIGARAGTPSASPAGPTWRHGLSTFGDLKYPVDFAHFDYVNPDAPKAGLARQGAIGTYDNFNLATAGLKGDLVTAITLIYDTLMLPSLDEVSSEYGLIAEAAAYPADISWVRFRLRRAAAWHDGTPISVDDVIFSLHAFRENNPQLATYYRHVTGAERTGEREVTFRFDTIGIREMPLIVGELTILPKHWWQGTDPAGRGRDIGKTTLEPPLGSGPYRIKSFETGSTIVYERVRDYWARDLPVRIGCANFDELRVDYFRDPSVEFQAFQAGALDWRVENSARNWATGYGFPAARQGRVVREEFPIRNMGLMQAFAFNLRRRKFADPRLRRACNFALDFEEINRQIFYGQYRRIASYFEGTELASSGLPQGLELDILRALREQVPPDVFTQPYWNPVGGSDEAHRANLLTAMQLLASAGFVVRDFRLVDARTSEPLAVEFLFSDANIERVVLFYQSALQRLGMAVAVRQVDDIQYVNRLRDWDFDIIVASWEQSLSPGNEQRDYWGSVAADVPGSRNLIGIKNPACDALIERIVRAENRDELVAATRALDRVLLWNHYVVPQWTAPVERTARWDRFGRPDRMPQYGASAFPTLWWWDATRARKV